MKIVCIADTHSLHLKLTIPEGDILIHAGDMSMRDDLHEIEKFNQWFSNLPHKHKILIAGNHDFCFEREPEKARSLLTNCTYLEDDGIEIQGVKIYGSPWQPVFHNWAFNLPRAGKEIREKWEMIPDDTDILVTHGPAYGYGDLLANGKDNVGCEELTKRIQTIKPKYHIFGHIHEAYGTYSDDNTEYINASICTLSYKPSNKPITIEI